MSTAEVVTTRFAAMFREMAEQTQDDVLSKIDLMPMGIAFVNAPEFSFDDWQHLGRALSTLSGAIHWWIGDWLAFGEAVYGEMYSQAMGEFGFAYDTLARDKWVATRFTHGQRDSKLSFQHHREIAALASEDERVAWLSAAGQRGLTVKDLRVALRAKKLAESGRKVPPTMTELLALYKTAMVAADQYIVALEALCFVYGLHAEEKEAAYLEARKAVVL